MTIQLLNLENYQDVLETGVPLFSNYKLWKIYSESFGINVKVISLQKQEGKAAIAVTESRQGEFTQIGKNGQQDIFDFIPLSYTNQDIAIKLLQELSECNKFPLKTLSEIPANLASKLIIVENKRRLKINPGSIIPQCLILNNPHLHEGRILLKKKHRKEMARKLNKIKLNFEHRIELDIDQQTFFKYFIDFFKDSSNPEKRLFMNEQTQNFFYGLIRLPEIKLSGMWFSQDLVSLAIYFDHSYVRYLYNMSSDPDFQEYAPGLIHIYELLKKTIEGGFREFNFLRGTERYKFEVGANACTRNYQIVTA